MTVWDYMTVWKIVTTVTKKNKQTNKTKTKTKQNNDEDSYIVVQINE